MSNDLSRVPSSRRAGLPDRRSALLALGAATGLAAASARAGEDETKVKGNIKQSVCRWCYGRIPIEKLAPAVKKIGYQSIELLLPAEYKPVKEAGLSCAVIGRPSISDGLNRKENHA